jgi:hypothetical protein
VFKKKSNEKAFNRSFKDRSFRLALEELLQEHPKKAEKKHENEIKEDQKEESSDSQYYPVLENEEERRNVQESFILPADNIKDAMVASIPESITQELTQVGGPISFEGLSPCKFRLLDTNTCFRLYPVLKNQGEKRLQLPNLRNPTVKIDVWGLLKDNIGKSLSRITMPVYLNEPISML